MASKKSLVNFGYKLKTSTTLAGVYAEVCPCRMLSTNPPLSKVVVRVDELADETKKIRSGKRLIGDIQGRALCTPAQLTILVALWVAAPGLDNSFYMIEYPLEVGEATPYAIKFEGVLREIGAGEASAESTSACEIPFTIEGSGDVTEVPATLTP